VKNFTIALITTMAMGIAGHSPAVRAADENDPRLQVAGEMVRAWNEQNWDRVYDLFAEDGVLHSMMMEPIVGRENIRSRLSALEGGIERIELQIRNSGIINDVVVLERVDDFVFNGEYSRVPVVGVMEIAGGKVQEWREYYDHESLVEALTPDPGPIEEVLAESEVEIRGLIDKLQVDWNGGDMTAYLDAYWNDEEFSLMFGDKAVRGWQSVSDMFTSTWTTEEAMGNFQTNNVEVRFTGTDLAIASGGFEHVFPTETIVGSFTHVFRRFDDGRWLIIHEHTSRGQVH
jgi:limonene-1,2-epoxide hydrolase